MMAANLQLIRRKLIAHLTRITSDFRAECQHMTRGEAKVVVLATAFSVGTLVSMVPIPVLDMMLAALVMRLLHRLPRGPIFAAMAVWNNMVMAPLYATSPRLGGGLISTVSAHSSLRISDAILPRVLIGNAAMACVLVAFSFVCALAVFSIMRFQRPALKAGH